MPAVIGGYEAEVHEIPWQVGVQFNHSFPFCGGTIIGPSTILTAAHCVTDRQDGSDIYLPHQFKILVAEHDHTTVNDANTMYKFLF